MPGHGGNITQLAAQAGRSAADLLDFSANVNPLGPPAWLVETVLAALPGAVHYPEPEADTLRAAAAGAWGVTPDRVAPGNGSSELLYALPRAVAARRLVYCPPAYIDYVRAAAAARIPVLTVPRGGPEAGFAVDWAALRRVTQAGDLVILGHPNNPSGQLLDPGRVRDFAAAKPEVTLGIDEAFIDFVTDLPSLLPAPPPNVVVLRSLTKFYAIPGLRLGAAVATPEVAAALRAQLPDWSVNCLAQAIGCRALVDDDYARRTRAVTTSGRADLLVGLAGIRGLAPVAGTANFLLVHGDEPLPPATALARQLLVHHGIAIRVCSNYPGLGDRWFRIAVRRPDENRRLLAALRELCVASPAEEANPA